jgi:hypothetical protein
VALNTSNASNIMNILHNSRYIHVKIQPEQRIIPKKLHFAAFLLSAAFLYVSVIRFIGEA